MTHHSYGAPGAHHLMFADLVNKAAAVGTGKASAFPEFSVDLDLLGDLYRDPVYLPGTERSWPELEQTEDYPEDGSIHVTVTARFPLIRGDFFRWATATLAGSPVSSCTPARMTIIGFDFKER